jgi:hypothetical protein
MNHDDLLKVLDLDGIPSPVCNRELPLPPGARRTVSTIASALRDYQRSFVSIIGKRWKGRRVGPLRPQARRECFHLSRLAFGAAALRV